MGSHRVGHDPATNTTTTMAALGLPGGSVVKNLPANAGDTGDTVSIPGWRRSPRVGGDTPLQYSCLGNPTDRSLAGYSS